MGKPPEYISPWADQQPTDPEERRMANEALDKLVSLYHTPETAGTSEGQIAASRRLNYVVETYYRLFIRAAAEGLAGEKRESFIRAGLMEDALIDPSDGAKADGTYRVISAGYELNRPYWDVQLGRRRRLRNQLKDLRR